MRVSSPLRRGIWPFIVYLLFTCQTIFAGQCEQSVSQVYQALWVQEILAAYPGLRGPANPLTAIKRVGSYRSLRDFPGKLPGYFEVSLKGLLPVHPIPNPYREGSSQKLAEVKSNIQKNGFELRHPVQIGLMPDGSLQILGGHHRIEAMKQLGEKTVPAELFHWNSLEPRVRELYEDAFLNFYRDKFPEYYPN